ncbi:hypothetical protein M885DRAFT_617933, partial [Pelagophyceae sp. CCMP2097]
MASLVVSSLDTRFDLLREELDAADDDSECDSAPGPGRCAPAAARGSAPAAPREGPALSMDATARTQSTGTVRGSDDGTLALFASFARRLDRGAAPASEYRPAQPARSERRSIAELERRCAELEGDAARLRRAHAADLAARAGREEALVRAHATELERQARAATAAAVAADVANAQLRRLPRAAQCDCRAAPDAARGVPTEYLERVVCDAEEADASRTTAEREAAALCAEVVHLRAEEQRLQRQIAAMLRDTSTLRLHVARLTTELSAARASAASTEPAALELARTRDALEEAREELRRRGRALSAARAVAEERRRAAAAAEACRAAAEQRCARPQPVPPSRAGPDGARRAQLAAERTAAHDLAAALADGDATRFEAARLRDELRDAAENCARERRGAGASASTSREGRPRKEGGLAERASPGGRRDSGSLRNRRSAAPVRRTLRIRRASGGARVGHAARGRRRRRRHRGHTAGAARGRQPQARGREPEGLCPEEDYDCGARVCEVPKGRRGAAPAAREPAHLLDSEEGPPSTAL